MSNSIKSNVSTGGSKLIASREGVRKPIEETKKSSVVPSYSSYTQQLTN
jgi:hypothetical protein